MKKNFEKIDDRSHVFVEELKEKTKLIDSLNIEMNEIKFKNVETMKEKKKLVEINEDLHQTVHKELNLIENDLNLYFKVNQSKIFNLKKSYENLESAYVNLKSECSSLISYFLNFNDQENSNELKKSFELIKDSFKSLKSELNNLTIEKIELLKSNEKLSIMQNNFECIIKDLKDKFEKKVFDYEKLELLHKTESQKLNLQIENQYEQYNLMKKKAIKLKQMIRLLEAGQSSVSISDCAIQTKTINIADDASVDKKV